MKRARLAHWLSGLGAAGVLGLTITLVGRGQSAGTPAPAPTAVPSQILPQRPNGPQPPNGAQLKRQLTKEQIQAMLAARAARDFSKGRIERPIKQLLAGPAQPPRGPQPPNGGPPQLQLTNAQIQAIEAANAAPDFSKDRIERPVKRLLASPTTPAQPPAGKPAFVNPRVQPGKVHWHVDLATACGASLRSGKPVLLFSMMGRLDLQFC